MHLPQSTVGEAVRFSAALRLPAGTPAEEVTQRVEEVSRLGSGRLAVPWGPRCCHAFAPCLFPPSSQTHARTPCAAKPCACSPCINQVLELVELGGIRGAPVGVPGQWGLSQEQRKRLTIAVELVGNPSLLFLE